MIRVSVPYFYDLGTKLNKLATVQPNMTLLDAWASMWGSKATWKICSRQHGLARP